MAEERERFYRSRQRVFGGVAEGTARHFGIDPFVMRVMVVVITLLTAGLVIPVYLGMWLLLPEEDLNWGPVDLAVDGAEDSRSRPHASHAERMRMLSVGTLLMGLLVVLTLLSIFALSLVRPVSVLEVFPAMFSMALGCVRFAVPGAKGYTPATLLAGAALFLLGAVVTFWIIFP